MPKAQHDKVSLELPAGWSDGTQLLLVGPDEGRPRSNVLVAADAVRQGESAQTVAVKQVPALKKALPELKISKEAAATFGANSGWLREQTFKADGQDFGQLQFIIVREKQAFTLTFTHAASDTGARKTAEALFASFAAK